MRFWYLFYYFYFRFRLKLLDLFSVSHYVPLLRMYRRRTFWLLGLLENGSVPFCPLPCSFVVCDPYFFVCINVYNVYIFDIVLVEIRSVCFTCLRIFFFKLSNVIGFVHVPFIFIQIYTDAHVSCGVFCVCSGTYVGKGLLSGSVDPLVPSSL